MNRIFYNIIILACSLLVGWAIILFSIRPGWEVKEVIGFTNEKIWSKVSLQNQEGKYKAKLETIDAATTKVSQNTPMLVEFGRLSSFIYLAPAWEQKGVITQSGTTGIVIGKTSGIISLYDLFLSYTIYDSENLFRIEQITNGSLYVGKEEDKKIAIYAIDSVIRLNLLHENEEMTSLILFPGSYIRFDPARNRSLKNADLFRTILSLKEIDNEVFEYVNPRVNLWDDKDAFFNYRLPSSSINLFRILSARFQESVNQTNLIRQRYIAYANNSTDESKWLFNPSKKNHNLLIELSTLLASVIDSRADNTEKIEKIAELYNKTKTLNLKESTARSLVEQFLLDGRFAQYSGNSRQWYQQLYEEIARLIGIERTDAKSKLFQNLADIYSRNLYTQKKTDSTVQLIDIYWPTAIELASTFEKNEIPKKDYFDIAIYAYNILRKLEDRPQVLPLSALENLSTYSYLLTFFQASNKYIESVDDIEKKQQTIVSFSRQFYDYILTLVVNSLYSAYIVDEDGALFLSASFREADVVQMNEEVIDRINAFYSTADAITTKMQSLWTETQDQDATIFQRIRTNMVRLRAFVEIINPEKYREYVNTPFMYDSGSTLEFPFPLIDSGSNMPIRIESSIIESIRNAKQISTDPRIAELKKIWPDADPTNWILEGEDIRVTQAPYRIGRAWAWNSSVKISALYKDKSFADGIIYYDNYQMRVVTEKPMSVQVYKAFLLQLKNYLDFIDKEVVTREDQDNIGEIAIFPLVQRIRIGESLYSLDIQEEEN